MTETKCQKCGSDKLSRKTRLIHYICGSLDWRGAPIYNRDNEIIGTRGFAQSDKCRIAELSMELLDRGIEIEWLKAELAKVPTLIDFILTRRNVELSQGNHDAARALLDVSRLIDSMTRDDKGA